MNDPQAMIAAYFEGTLTADQVAELEHWLRADRARAVALVREAMLGCHLAELLREENLEHIATDPSHDSQFGALLAALDAPPGSAELVKIAQELKGAHPARSHRTDTNPITAHDLAAVTGYLLRQALTCKPAILAYAAAIALLAAVLLIPQIHSLAPPIAQHPPAITQPAAPPAAPIVATLTATHNAQWAEGALAPGTKLHADQTLTLTAGFAEITTNRGAVAILEAPATIELTDHDNALRLHTGKLVGICETESSKGFVVHTTNARIVDIGTEFGVTRQAQGELEVHVLSGQVVAKPQSALGEGEAVLLEEDQALRISPDAMRVTAIPSKADAFANILAIHAEQRYAEAVKALNPVAYYRFESLGQDGVVLNQTGDRYHADALGPVTLVDAGAGSALKLDVIEDQPAYLKVGNFNALSGAEQYTVECWVQPATRHNGAIIAFMDARPDRSMTSATTLQVTTQTESDSSFVRFTHRNPPANTGGTEANDDNPYTPGRWVHMVGVVTPQGARLYIDGELVDTQPSPGPMADAELNMHLGVTHPDLGLKLRKQFGGLIDEVAIYATALNEDQITRHHALMRQTLTRE